MVNSLQRVVLLVLCTAGFVELALCSSSMPLVVSLLGTLIS